MKGSERDAVLIEHMLDCIDRIERYLPGGRSDFFASELARDAVVRNLQTLAESSQRLSDEGKRSHPEIDWRAMSGFRNILVHDYLGLDLNLIWLVIENELPSLKKTLEDMQAR